jgi:hypothetical protein
MLVWIFISAAGGILGGMTRAIVGMSKVLVMQQRKRRKKTPWLSGVYFTISLIIAGLVGLVAGMLARGDWVIAYLAGYVGVDLLDGLYFIREKSLSPSRR